MNRLLAAPRLRAAILAGLAILALLPSAAVWAQSSNQTGRPELLYYRFNEGAGNVVTNAASTDAAYTTAVFRDNDGATIGLDGVYDGTPMTPTWTAPGRFGRYAARPDNGIDQGFIDTGLPIDRLTAQSFTIDFWIRGGESTISESVLGARGSFHIYINGSVLFVEAPQQGLRLQTPAGAVTDGNWHHVAYVSTRDRENPIASNSRLYVDGVLVATDARRFDTSLPNQGAQIVYVTVFRFESGGDISRFNGDRDVDELRIWSVPLSGDEVAGYSQTELPALNGLRVQTRPLVVSQQVDDTTTGLPMLALDVFAAGVDQRVSSIRISRRGTLPADGQAAVSLYRDVDRSDTISLSDQFIVAGTWSESDDLTFPLTGTLLDPLPAGSGLRLLIAVDMTNPTMTDEEGVTTVIERFGTFGVQIEASTDIAVSPGPVSLNFPRQGPIRARYEVPTALPIETDFEEQPTNLTVATAAGAYPQYDATGMMVLSTTTTLAGTAGISSFRSLEVEPATGEEMLGLFPTPAVDDGTGTFAGTSAAAADFRLDLSAVDLTATSVLLTFDRLSLNTTVGALDGIFVKRNPTDSASEWELLAEFAPPPSTAVGLREWETTSIDLSTVLTTLAGMDPVTVVDIRFQAGHTDDGAAVGMLFDDVSMYAGQSGLAIEAVNNEVVPQTVEAGQTIGVARFRLTATATDQDIFVLRVTKTGTLSDATVTRVRLFADQDGDGTFDVATEELDETTVSGFTNGERQFTGPPLLPGQPQLPLVSVPIVAGQPTGMLDLLVTFEFGTVAEGQTIGCEITATSSLVVANNEPVSGTFPISSPTFRTFSPVRIFPWTEGFEDGVPANTTITTAATESYPATAGTGITIIPGDEVTPDEDARIRLATTGPIRGLQPIEGSAMAAIDAPNGDSAGTDNAVGAIDFRFDLSNFDALNDRVAFAFSWAATEEELSATDHVFISLDDGATWLTAAYAFNYAFAGSRDWTRTVIDLSSSIRAINASNDFTDQVVIRFQNAGSQAFGQDGLAIDDLALGVSGQLLVQRQIGTPLPSGTTDTITSIAGPGTTQVTYQLSNTGQLPVRISRLQIENESSNVNEVIGLPSVPITIESGGTTTVSFSVILNDRGDFSFDWVIGADDIDLLTTGGFYRLTLTGTGTNVPPRAEAPTGSPFTVDADGRFLLFVDRLQTLEDVVLLLVDDNDDDISITSVKGQVLGVTGPGRVSANAPLQIDWTGAPTQRGIWDFEFTMSDGEGDPVVFNVRFVVLDVAESGCTYNPTGGRWGVPGWLLGLLLLLGTASIIRRRRPSLAVPSDCAR